ncbi:hypothetical protein [Pseudomonas sp. KU43P]|uniref:hypothetical protein n=1 Tax=Pseudomonas sp. KU43P TaxID=2487887 RepID=UPI002954EA36|nr:hypothetical protein [Pseudomonas sp. KU43P]
MLHTCRKFANDTRLLEAENEQKIDRFTQTSLKAPSIERMIDKILAFMDDAAVKSRFFDFIARTLTGRTFPFIASTATP